jgi:hypothetical protein
MIIETGRKEHRINSSPNTSACGCLSINCGVSLLSLTPRGMYITAVMQGLARPSTTISTAASSVCKPNGIVSTTNNLIPLKEVLVLPLRTSLRSRSLRPGWHGQSPSRPIDINLPSLPCTPTAVHYDFTASRSGAAKAGPAWPSEVDWSRGMPLHERLYERIWPLFHWSIRVSITVLWAPSACLRVSSISRIADIRRGA